MTHRPLQLVALTLLTVAAFNAAESEMAFPGHAPNQQLMEAQEKGDQLFEKGEYERAMLIYRQELAPTGDKYAQYMVGYMFLTGQGVNEDLARASAWYRLAAERGHESFVRARDLLWQSLNNEQRVRSDQIYTELRRAHGDVTIISTLIAEDLAQLRRRSRSVPDFRLNAMRRSDYSANGDYNRRLREHIETRVNYLLGLVPSDAGIAVEEQNQIAKIAAEVRRELRARDAVN